MYFSVILYTSKWDYTLYEVTSEFSYTSNITKNCSCAVEYEGSSARAYYFSTLLDPLKLKINVILVVKLAILVKSDIHIQKKLVSETKIKMHFQNGFGAIVKVTQF